MRNLLAVLILAAALPAYGQLTEPETNLVSVGRTETAVWNWTARAPHHNAIVRVRCPFVGGAAASGSGCMIAHQGQGALVLTAAHVVEGHQRVTVISTRTGNEFAADVIGADYETDLALLYAPNALPAVTLAVGNFDPKAGDRIEIVGLGGPTGKLRHFAAKVLGIRNHRCAINVNTAVISGDSGAPMICDGRVVGVVRGGERIIPQPNGWNDNVPAQSDAGGTYVQQIVSTWCQRRGLFPIFRPRCPPGGSCIIPGNTAPTQPTPKPPVDDVTLSPPENYTPQAGPQGPAGPPGERGPRGPKGDPGRDAEVTEQQLAAIAAAITQQLKNDPSLRGQDGRDAVLDMEQLTSDVAASLPPFTFVLRDEAGNVVDTDTVPIGGTLTLQLYSKD